MLIIKKLGSFMLLLVAVMLLTGCDFFSKPTTSQPASTYNAADKLEIIAETLKLFDSSYTLNMTLEDFEYEFEYDGYRKSLRFAEAYADELATKNITKETAIKTVEQLSQLPGDLMGIDNFTELKAFIDEFKGLGYSTEVAVDMILNLTKVLLEIALEQENIPNEILTKVTKFKDVLTTDKETLKKSIVTVVDYIGNVYNNFDVDFVNMLDSAMNSGNLTTEEIIIIKDEINEALSEALPTVADFENVYMIANVFLKLAFENNTITIDSELIHAAATISHNESKLFIELVRDFDLEMFNELKALVLAVETPSDIIYDDVTGEYTYIESEFHVDKFIDLILYIDTYFDGFKAEHKATFDAISAVDTEAIRTKAYGLFENILVTAINEYAGEMPQKAMVLELIEDLFDHMDVFDDARELFTRLGVNAYDLFIETEGEILLIIDEISKMTDSTPIEKGAILQSLLTEIVAYNDITLGDLSQDDLTTIIRYVILMAKYQAVNIEYSLDIEDTINALYALAPTISEIIYPFINLETELLRVFEENQIPLDMFNNGEYQTMELVIDSLKEVLTTERRNNIHNSFVTLFDEVFKDSVISTKIAIDTEDIDYVKSVVLDRLDRIYELVDILSQYDFENLNEQQEIEYNEFKELIITFFDAVDIPNEETK